MNGVSSLTPTSTLIHVAQVLKPGVIKICVFATKHFELIQSSVNLGLGLKELFINRRHHNPTHPHHPRHVINDLWNAREHRRGYYESHGSILTLAGATGIAAAVTRSTAIKICNRGLSVFANVVALKFHAELLLRPSTPPHERKSAFIGMMSNINYIISVAVMLLGFEVGLILFFLVISNIFGGIKVLFDLIAKTD